MRRECLDHIIVRRGASAPNPAILCGLLQRHQNSSIPEQGCAGLPPGSAHRCDQFTRHPGWTSPPLRPGLSFRYTQATARNTTTVALETLLDGQAQALTQKAIDLALAGDITALRLRLDRILIAQQSGWEARDNQNGESVSRRG